MRKNIIDYIAINAVQPPYGTNLLFLAECASTKEKFRVYLPKGTENPLYEANKLVNKILLKEATPLDFC